MNDVVVTIEPRPHGGPAKVVFPTLSWVLQPTRVAAIQRKQLREFIVQHCVLEFGTGTLEGSFEEGFTFRCDTTLPDGGKDADSYKHLPPRGNA